MNPVFPLTCARSGEWVRVVSIEGGHKSRHRLYQIGIFPGALVRIEMIGSRGPVILSVGKARVGVGRGAAEKIIVEPVELTR